MTRGGRVESRHRGSLVLLDAAGSVAVAAGLVDQPVFARSTLKPMQAAALVAAGFTQPSTDRHRAGVQATLAAAGLSEAALGCPADLPWGREAQVTYVAAGGVAASICHNCSGKHAAMLATCAGNGWDLAGYLAPEHPVQLAILERIERLCGEAVADSSVDGCGAPAHAVSLRGLARGFAAIAAAPAGSVENAVTTAMRAHPVLVGGCGRAVSEFLAEVDGLVTKDGAEGVWAAAVPDGRAFAVKIEDGAARALPPLVAAVLGHWGFDGPAVRRWTAVPVLGGGAQVGAISQSVELRGLLNA